MISHKSSAESLLDLLAVNEDRTTDPLVLAAWAQTHALLAIVEAIQEIKS